MDDGFLEWMDSVDINSLSDIEQQVFMAILEQRSQQLGTAIDALKGMLNMPPEDAYVHRSHRKRHPGFRHGCRPRSRY